jgi:excisionase family DNA binding protein
MTQAEATSTERPYSVAQLAERWDCSEGLVRKLIRRGVLASFRLGTLTRIPAAEVARFEAQRDEPPKPAPARVIPRARRRSPL